MTKMTDPVQVEVAYALPERQWLVQVSLAPGSTAMDAVALAAETGELPALSLAGVALAVWGREVDRDYIASPGDRVEILRPMKIDPRTARRQLAAAGRVMGERGGVTPD